MPPKNKQPPRRVPATDSSDDAAPPPKKHPKHAMQDSDASGAAQSSQRAQRNAQPSAKQRQHLENKEAKAQAEIARLQKQVQYYKNHNTPTARQPAFNRVPDGLPVESEGPSDEDEDTSHGIQSAFTRGQAIPWPQPQPTVQRPRTLRREGDPPRVESTSQIMSGGTMSGPSTPQAASVLHSGSQLRPATLENNVDSNTGTQGRSPSPSSHFDGSDIYGPGGADDGDGAPLVPHSDSEDLRTHHAEPLVPSRVGMLTSSSRIPESRRLAPASSRNANTARSAVLREPQFRHGTVPTGRAKADNYTDDVKHIILEAVRQFECRLYTIDAFPDSERQLIWAQEAWESANEAFEDPDKYRLTDRILGMIKSRKSNARGDVVDEARTLIEGTYGFVDSEKPGIQRQNAKLYQDLMHQTTFAYKEYDLIRETRKDYAQNDIIKKLIRLCFFKNKKAVGVRFHTNFNPIPFPTIALLLTAVEHCIEEWSTGTHKHAPFRESDNKERYINHCRDLADWETLDPEKIKKKRKRWHDSARSRTGATVENPTTGRISSAAWEDARKDLAQQTGETDSE